MQPTSPDKWKPAANMLLVAVPSRFTYAHTPGQKRLVLPSGSDDWQALGEQLKAGINVQIETDEQPIPVRQGLVLATCGDWLTDGMDLGPGRNTRSVPRMEAVIENGRTVPGRDGKPIMRWTGTYTTQPIMRTAAQITQQIEVGDTIHFDDYALNDASEVSPGVYLIGYVDVIARLVCRVREDLPKLTPEIEPEPIGGYVLLTRAWAADVEDAEVEGRTRKVRKGALGLIDVIDVPPLPNEGIVAYHSAPLRNVPQEVAVGDRVVIDHRHARVETIAGVEYLAVRQDFILLVRESKQEESIEIEVAGVGKCRLNLADLQKQRDFTRQQEFQAMEYWHRQYNPHLFNKLPLHHPAYNA